ncbi:hypothetical protein [Aeromonas dhakensis]|uniref:hypothetical protein n=1 Tax=Aeromonas dhakensis TaxID=196024 RepID=UPI00398635FF
MKILNEIFAMIESHPQTGSSGVLAAAMASACNAHYAVSLLDVSVKLDDNGRRLVDRLARITQESDYSNAAQDKALHRLRVLGFIN